MKRTLFFTLTLIATSLIGRSQTLTELVVPKYMGSKSAASTNNCRTAFTICLKIDGLVSNTSYDIKAGLGLITDPVTSYGAGNVWVGGSFQAVNMINYFITDPTGNSGPFWIIFQPTGNSTRFDGGQQHNLRIGYTVNGNSMPGSPSFVGSKIITALDIPNTPRTSATTDDGAFVNGSAMPSATGKYVLFYDNVNGTGDPLFSFIIRQAISTQVANTELPTPINDVYMQAGTSAVGDYPAVIPIGANNPNGVRRIEARNADNTTYAFNTDSDGIWPSGGNTTTPIRREVVYITNTDAPLVPSVLAPTIITAPVTNITTYTATGGGNVTSDGGAIITERGVCCATTHNPTTSGNHTTEPGTTGSFVSIMTGLSPNTQYYVRAYATNSVGTSYGGEIGFFTLCEPYAPVSNFWVSKTNIMVDDSINFFDSTLYCPTVWNWSFIGGIPMTSNLQNPTIIKYYYPGIYNVCLTTTNNYGIQTTCKMGYITVNPPLNAKIVITEISYNPPEHGTDSLEYLELYNNDTVAWNLENFYFSEGFVYTFPNYDLAPQSYVLVAKSSAAMMNTFGVTALQWTSGALSNTGELVRLKDPYNKTVDSVHYLPSQPWDSMANGRGPSLELCDPNSNNALGENWRHAIEFKTVNTEGDSIWASPGAGCSYLPMAKFIVSDTSIVVGQSVIFTDSSQAGITTWNWTFEQGTPGSFNGQSPPSILYDQMGSFDVILQVTNNVGSSTLIKTDYITVGPNTIPKSFIDEPITIYPNPNTGCFSVVMKGTYPHEIKIITTLGQIIAVEHSANAEVKIDIFSPSRGIYFLQVKNELLGNMFNKKFTVN